MWDSEGKEVDDFVVKKLLTKYPNFFKHKKLGKDVFITLRVPNPTVEKEEAKILVEALESIPRSMDAAKVFYENPYPPIFEVILPMTTSAKELNRVYYFYKNFVSGKQYQKIYENDITIAEWVGEFLPETINVIPLFEDIKTLFNVDKILRKYLKNKNFNYLRVFLARSDPAMNYGMISAVLAIKIALKKFEKVSAEEEIEIYPILGAGTPPFRGNLSPYTVEKVFTEYPSIETFTVQSAFKYDYSIEDVINGIKKLRNFIRHPLEDFDENFCKKFIEKFSKEYHNIIVSIAPAINELAKAIFSIGAVKGMEMGAGFKVASMKGSENNDPISPYGFLKNDAGGTLGGISSGQDIVIRVAVKPIPSIRKTQKTINERKEEVEISVGGRHDISAIPRIVPVIEAMVRIILADHLLRQLANLAPISIPFTAPILNIALARSAFSLSKTGSPKPAGTPLARTSTIPPRESPSFFIFSIFSHISL